MALAPARNGRERLAQVALLDDDPGFRAALADGLVSFGFSVIALDSEQALFNTLDGVVLDCLILDYHLTERNGIEVQASLNLLGFNVPIVFLSACTTPSIVQAALQAGAAYFMTKPVRLDELVTTIGRTIEASI